MNLLFDALFASVAFGHLVVDTLNGQRAILLTYLSGPLGLNNTALGTATTIYILSAALAQPFFGWATDRIGARWVVSGGIIWMASFFSLALLIPGPASLLLFVIASIGSGAFHPAGTMQAALRGRTHFSGRETTAASYFFVFGQLGFFFGPILAGPILDHFGTSGLLVTSIPALVVGFITLRTMARTQPVPQRVKIEVLSPTPRLSIRGNILVIIAFILYAGFQSWATQNMTTFIPKFLSDLGKSASLYGAITGLGMGGTALGNVIGGHLADRFGKRRVAFLAMLLGSIPILMIPLSGSSYLLYLLIPLAGFFTGGVGSIVVVQAQRFIPGGMGLASGLILGLLFSSGALGTWFSGWLADQWGFGLVFYLTGFLALFSAFFALAVKDN